MNNLELQVKKANKSFYDIVGASYEDIDGRRSEDLLDYVSKKLEKIASLTEPDSILDMGCGSGFISRIARQYFRERYALDISHKIVKAIDDKNLHRITADSDLIPMQDASLSCVAAFAVLHHCYSYVKMFSEINRVLKKGGVFYSDHDMDSFFFNRFRPLLKTYRRINDASRHYMSKFSQLSEEIYNCSEFHQDGIPSGEIESMLRNIGFKDVRLEYHWYGLSSMTNKIFGRKIYKRGYGPLARIIAVK